jgi:hypothetical protein
MKANLVERITTSTESARALALQLRAEGSSISRDTIAYVRKNGGFPAAKQRRYDAPTIARIHASIASNRAMAAQLQGEGISITTETVRQIRAGLMYADMVPKKEATTGSSCDRCRHWRGVDAIEPCDLGHRDPIDEGLGFARFCATYGKAPG